MFETVTVDEALAKGKHSVNYPSLGILIGGIILIVILVILFPNQAAIFSLGGLAFVFIGAWLYWSLAITKWRLWAFENVRNVHELKKRAVQNQLIGKEGGFIEKTEIRTADDKMRWAELQTKFNVPDIFHDDLSIPSEVEVRYSNNTATFLMVLGVALFAGGCFFIFGELQWPAAAILTTFGIWMLAMGYRRYNNREAQIILNNSGVTAWKIPFYSWADISHEDTKIVHQGKSATTYFIYTTPQGNHQINIGELDVCKSRLEKLLRVYRGRFDNKKASLTQPFSLSQPILTFS